MIRVGILTFHDGINHGAFMQAFSLYQFLRQNGYNAEIINYKNVDHLKNEFRAFLLTKRPKDFVSNISKILAFKRDQKVMNLGKLEVKSSRVSDSYDIIVVGSDIVWNYKWSFLGNDPIYFGRNLNCKKLISYAPSFGNVSVNDSRPSHVISGIQSFDAISVRDANSADIVESIVGSRPQIVLDPTFLIDSIPYEKGCKKCDSDYLLVYAYLLQPEEIQSAIEFSRSKGLKIVSVGYSNKWADENIVSLGPFEWLSYIRNANFVLTSTFHGTIFSIKYERNFVTSINDSIRNKTVGLLEEIGLINRCVESSNVDPIFEIDIDYQMVNKKLSYHIDHSKKFLRNSLVTT